MHFVVHAKESKLQTNFDKIAHSIAALSLAYQNIHGNVTVHTTCSNIYMPPTDKHIIGFEIQAKF